MRSCSMPCRIQEVVVTREVLYPSVLTEDVAQLPLRRGRAKLQSRFLDPRRKPDICGRPDALKVPN